LRPRRLYPAGGALAVATTAPPLIFKTELIFSFAIFLYPLGMT
jgi:hypothetical protein